MDSVRDVATIPSDEESLWDGPFEESDDEGDPINDTLMQDGDDGLSSGQSLTLTMCFEQKDGFDQQILSRMKTVRSSGGSADRRPAGKRKAVATSMLHRDLLVFFDRNLESLVNPKIRKQVLKELVEPRLMCSISKLGEAAAWTYYTKRGISAVISQLFATKRVQSCRKLKDFWPLGSRAIEPQYLQSIGFSEATRVSVFRYLQAKTTTDVQRSGGGPCPHLE